MYCPPPQPSRCLHARLLAVGLLLLASTGLLAQTTYPGVGAGPIPDRGVAGCGAPEGPPLEITFDVGATGPVEDIELDINMSHTWVGDVNVTLIAPDATDHVIFASTGSTTATGCGSGDDLDGIYTFSDDGTDDWWSLGSPYPEGDYQTTTPGDTPAGGEATSLVAAFAGVEANGTWTLSLTDSGGGDTGAVTAANLTVTTNPVRFLKRFNAPTLPGSTVLVTYFLRNDTDGPHDELSFTDDFTDAVPGMEVVNVPAGDVCGPGSFVAAGDGVIKPQGLSLDSGQLCSFTVQLGIPGATPFGVYLSSSSELVDNDTNEELALPAHALLEVGFVFIDGFETGDVTQWTSSTP